MMAGTFRGGVHPKENKIGTRIKEFAIPKRLVVPLCQHLGPVCSLSVKAGQLVKKYEVIAVTDNCMSAPVHAPTSGKIASIEEAPHPVLGRCVAAAIEPDGKDEPAKHSRHEFEHMPKDKIAKIIASKGIVGMGGAGCPTALKLDLKGKKPDIYILNGCECEPFITADHALMLRYPKEIMSGLGVLMKATGIRKAIIGIEDNKQDAIDTLRQFSKAKEGISVVAVKTKYPQGAENMLIHALTGRIVPTGKLPVEAGVIVNNVATAKAVHDAVLESRPCIERIVTVAGDVREPQNFLVRVGTLFSELIDACRPLGKPQKVIAGGPMMGVCQEDMDSPVTKTTNCIIVQRDADAPEESHCIRCGRCIRHCPMGLSPTTIARYAKQGKYALAKDHHADACFECGACSYVCPSRIPLVQYIRMAKGRVNRC